jgi:hypothetical protein
LGTLFNVQYFPIKSLKQTPSFCNFSDQQNPSIEGTDETDGLCGYMGPLRNKLKNDNRSKFRNQAAIKRMKKKASLAEMSAIALKSKWFRRNRLEIFRF